MNCKMFYKIFGNIKQKFIHLKTILLIRRDQFLGYIDKDGEPLKCTCGSKDLEYCNEDWLDGRAVLLEYDCRCKKCGKILNHWDYGHWSIY